MGLVKEPVTISLKSDLLRLLSEDPQMDPVTVHADDGVNRVLLSEDPQMGPVISSVEGTYHRVVGFYASIRRPTNGSCYTFCLQSN